MFRMIHVIYIYFLYILNYKLKPLVFLTFLSVFSVPRKSFVWGEKIDPSDPESKTVQFYGYDPFVDEVMGRMVYYYLPTHLPLNNQPFM